MVYWYKYITALCIIAFSRVKSFGKIIIDVLPLKKFWRPQGTRLCFHVFFPRKYQCSGKTNRKILLYHIVAKTFQRQKIHDYFPEIIHAEKCNLRFEKINISQHFCSREAQKFAEETSFTPTASLPFRIFDPTPSPAPIVSTENPTKNKCEHFTK